MSFFPLEKFSRNQKALLDISVVKVTIITGYNDNIGYVQTAELQSLHVQSSDHHLSVNLPFESLQCTSLKQSHQMLL